MPAIPGEAGGTEPSRPLEGFTVLVSRPEDKVEALAAPLEGLGAAVVRFPALTFAPPESPEPLRRAALDLRSYDWVAFTSPRGVRALVAAWAGTGTPGPRRVAVVGSATAEACREAGWAPDLIPERFDAEGLLEAFDRSAGPLEGRRVLLPLAEAARDVLPRGLEARGARVERVVAYRSVFPEDVQVKPVVRLLQEARVDLLTFTSPSTAENVLEALGDPVLGVPAAVIGPVTAEAARALGYRVAGVADPHTVDGLVQAVRRSLVGSGGGGG